MADGYTYVPFTDTVLSSVHLSRQLGRGEARILRLRGGGLETRSWRAQGLCPLDPSGGPEGRAPGGGSGTKPPEAESSVAFEAPVEELNLTLVTDSFLLSRWCWGRAKFADGGGLSPQASPCPRLATGLDEE